MMLKLQEPYYMHRTFLKDSGTRDSKKMKSQVVLGNISDITLFILTFTV